MAFPAAVGLFFDLASPISLRFLASFGSQAAAAGLDEQAIAAWLKTIPERGKTAPASVLCARLRAAPDGVTGEEGAAHAVITAALAATVGMLAAQIKVLEAGIGIQLTAHPDAHIFTSLPRAGRLRAARLLAEIGDCRSRYPGPQSLAALAGVTPVTRESGTHTSHAFRWAVNRPLRDAVAASRTAPGTPAPGLSPSTRPPAAAARTTRTRSASWAAPGSSSSGAAGRKAPPTTPPSTPPSSTSWPGRPRRQPRPAPGTPRDRRAHLRAARLRGRLLPQRGRTGLLISHGGFLDRPDFGAFIHAGTSITDGTTEMAAINWQDMITALHEGRLPVCGGEQRILRIAASIAGGTPVTLRDAIPGLDDRNLKLIITAIRHAAGHRPPHL